MQLPSSILIFRPSILRALRGYNRERLVHDTTAGITVGLMTLPVALAFAIASGLPPGTGLITAIMAGFLIALFSGCRIQIGGPSSAFIVIVYGIVERYGIPNLLIATMMSGIMLFLMGLFRLGTLIRFIPVAVVIGFTNGIAALIILSQLRDFLGLSIAKMPGGFFGIVSTLWTHLHTVNYYALGLALVTSLVLLGWQRLMPASGPDQPHVRGKLNIIPGTIIALIIGSLATTVLQLPVETIGSRFGGIPADFPGMTLPAMDWETTRFLFMPALTLAILCAIESLLCARVADNLLDERHNPNQELMAQGTANVITPLFGGMPAAGTISRTYTNFRSGATSPIAGMVHALALLLIVLLAAPLAANIPLPTLAAIMMFTAFNIGQWREFSRLRSYRMPYRITLLAVFLLTVVFDLTVAVEVGLVATCLTFIYRISSLTYADTVEPGQYSDIPRWNPGDMQVRQLHGALFFGAVKLIQDLEKQLPRRVVVLDLDGVIYLDSSGAEELLHLAKICHNRGITLILCGIKRQPQDMVERVQLLQRHGVRHADRLQDALREATALLPASALKPADPGPAADPIPA
ncbi:SulP family inorganic anion transporter [Brachymonas wangyanguii]|uniref:SulP family inorganic anion transporter n=1 Tax=Brachymonas wangyanguii TaxID=3130163 RepID=UPI00307E5476